MEERKTITMEELETLMTAKKGVFDANSADAYGFSVDLICKGVQFEKAMDNKTDYVSMILVCECGEIQIAPEIIEEIYLGTDGMITMEFHGNIPDLQIRLGE